jgi:hypothetical protein
MKYKTIAAMASALAMLLAPLQIAAAAHGTHGFHFSNRLHAGHHRGAYGAGYWPFYGGGIVAVPPYAPANTVNYVSEPTTVYVPLPPRALTCHRSRETVTVPAQAGGTTKITVTRC